MMWEDAYLRRIHEVIAEHGHAVQYVRGDPETGAPPFGYTVGLHQRPGHDYELAVAGLGPEASVGVLKSLAEALRESDTQPSDGLEIGGLLEHGLALRLRPVSHPEDLGVIGVVYGAIPPVWQVLWPDPANRFPGDPEYNMAHRLQPML